MYFGIRCPHAGCRIHRFAAARGQRKKNRRKKEYERIIVIHARPPFDVGMKTVMAGNYPV
jgi:hypothetical protein